MAEMEAMAALNPRIKRSRATAIAMYQGHTSLETRSSTRAVEVLLAYQVRDLEVMAEA